jgi:hypothetical protein
MPALDSVKRFVEVYRRDMDGTMDRVPEHYEQFPSGLIEEDHIIGEGKMVLRTKSSGTIRLFNGWYADNTISSKGVELVIVNQSVPEYNFAYYAIVIGGIVQIGEKTLPEATAYHLMSTKNRGMVGACVPRDTHVMTNDLFYMNPNLWFKPISKL